jgi:D-sedoheptulose 7-phosphate isomerase
MKGDPRDRNHYSSNGDISMEKSAYIEMYSTGMRSVDDKALGKALEVIEIVIQRKGRVFVAGNGGSAAIATHLTCDFTKGTHHEAHPTLMTESLSANPSMLTALANDFSFDQCFSLQIRMLAQKNDLVILISSSGNSPNIVKACEEAKNKGIQTIGLTGFKGGKLKSMADVSIHVEMENYGVVEDCHQSVMHLLAQHIARKRDGK